MANPPAPPLEFLVRPATEGDLDEIVQVHLKVVTDDPLFDYRFPYTSKYPEDSQKWTRVQFKEYFEQPEKFSVFVACIPSVGSAEKRDDGSSEARDEIIAFAVWDMAVQMPRKGGDHGINSRRDVDPARHKEFFATLFRGLDIYFKKYGEKQYGLWHLSTHPDYRRYGVGSTLCRWGMNKALEASYTLTLFGSPMGTPLYTRLGFELDGYLPILVSADEAQLHLSVMHYNSPS